MWSRTYLSKNQKSEIEKNMDGEGWVGGGRRMGEGPEDLEKEWEIEDSFGWERMGVQSWDLDLGWRMGWLGREAS